MNLNNEVHKKSPKQNKLLYEHEILSFSLFLDFFTNPILNTTTKVAVSSSFDWCRVEKKNYNYFLVKNGFFS